MNDRLSERVTVDEKSVETILRIAGQTKVIAIFFFLYSIVYLILTFRRLFPHQTGAYKPVYYATTYSVVLISISIVHLILSGCQLYFLYKAFRRQKDGVVFHDAPLFNSGFPAILASTSLGMASVILSLSTNAYFLYNS